MSERLDVPKFLLGPEPGERYVLRVVGDLMAHEGIQDGDLLVLLRDSKPAAGELIVALVGDDATLKRFYPRGDLVRLEAANGVQPPSLVPAGSVQIQGIVVGLMRKYNRPARAEALEADLRAVGTTCEDCALWLTGDCPRANVNGRGNGPSGEDPRCASFEESRAAGRHRERLRLQLQEETHA